MHEAHTKIALPQGLCVELKWLDGDEFAHWTNPESFATSTRNRRKRREWQVWNALQSGEVLENVVEVNAPYGVHGIVRVIHTWFRGSSNGARRPRAGRRSGRTDGRPRGHRRR